MKINMKLVSVLVSIIVPAIIEIIKAVKSNNPNTDTDEVRHEN